MKRGENQIDRPVLLRISEVARMMSISRSQAYQLVHLGELPSVRFLNSIRVRASDLDEYIRRHYSGWNESGGGM